MATWRGGYIYRGSRELVELNARIMAGRPDGLPRFGNIGARRAEAPCGTPAAYRRHRRNGEPACAACVAAETLRHRLRAEARRREAAA